MDTDDLSREAYEGIIIEADKLTPDLTLHYGLLAEDCENENDYLKKAESLTRKILKFKDYTLDDLFFGNPPDRASLDITLNKILKNIEQIRLIPVKKRSYDF
jgi:hypothetical protein